MALDTLDRGVIAVLRAIGGVSFPDSYSLADAARDFHATFLGDDPSGARLRTLATILKDGLWFEAFDVMGHAHSADPLVHIEGRRVLADSIVKRLAYHFDPPQPAAEPHDTFAPLPPPPVSTDDHSER